jgi:hypothetical protein
MWGTDRKLGAHVHVQSGKTRLTKADRCHTFVVIVIRVRAADSNLRVLIYHQKKRRYLLKLL